MATVSGRVLPADVARAVITDRARVVHSELVRAGGSWPWEHNTDVLRVVSLMLRQVPTVRRMVEMECGDGIHNGEWVNTNIDWIESRYDRAMTRLTYLAGFLPDGVTLATQGDPRGEMVTLLVTDDAGIVRRVGLDR